MLYFQGILSRYKYLKHSQICSAMKELACIKDISSEIFCLVYHPSDFLLSKISRFSRQSNRDIFYWFTMDQSILPSSIHVRFRLEFTDFFVPRRCMLLSLHRNTHGSPNKMNGNRMNVWFIYLPSAEIHLRTVPWHLFYEWFRTVAGASNGIIYYQNNSLWTFCSEYLKFWLCL